MVVQWLPDGRCAVLLNGRLVAVDNGIQRSDLARAIMWGNSVGTEVLLGPMEVWKGVVPEVAAALRLRGSKARPN